MEDFPTIIAVVGGAGTRLFPLTLNISKPTVDMCNKAILARLLEPLARQGIREVILAANGYENTAQLNKYFKDGKGFFAELGIDGAPDFMYQPNYRDKGSGDAVRFCAEYFDLKKEIMVVGGDNIIDVDIRSLLEAHRKKGSLLTIALKEIGPEKDISKFGVAELDSSLGIKKFVEKPPRGTEPSRFINGGLYLFSPEIREIFKKMGNKVKDLGGDVVPYLVENGYKVDGFVLDGYWADVGTPGSFLKTTIDVLHGKIKGIQLQNQVKDNQWIEDSTLKRNNDLKDVKIGENVLIGRHCQLGKDVEISNSSIGHFCIIEDGAKIKDSVVLSFVNIGKNVELSRCILGRFTTLEANCIISANMDVAITGDPEEWVPVVGGGGVTILENSVIGPKKRVAPLNENHRIISTRKFIELGMDRHNTYFMEK